MNSNGCELCQFSIIIYNILSVVAVSTLGKYVDVYVDTNRMDCSDDCSVFTLIIVIVSLTYASYVYHFEISQILTSCSPINLI